MTSITESQTRLVVDHAGARALPTGTRSGLLALGYELVAPSRKAASPDLRLVDERRWDGVPVPDEDPNVPIVLLVGGRARPSDDPRIAAILRRPCTLAEAYAAFQGAMERTPRRSPRIATRLAARIIRADRRWPGAILSLSERGALVRGAEGLEPGEAMNLQFALPGVGLVHARARAVGPGGGGVGVSFDGASGALRRTVSEFVTDQLVSR